MSEYKNNNNNEHTDMLMYETHGITEYVNMPDDAEEKFLAMITETTIECEELESELVVALNHWRSIIAEVSLNDGCEAADDVSYAFVPADYNVTFKPLHLATHTDTEQFDLDIEAAFNELDNYHRGCKLANATKALKR